MGSDNAALLRRLQRLDAVDGRQLCIEGEVAAEVAQIADPHALERASHASRRGAHTIVYEGGRLVHFDNHLTAGGIACAMSHRLALQRVAEHPTADWGLILEDDIEAAVPHAERAIQDILARLPENWDAVFLGYHDTPSSLHPDVAGAVPLRPLLEPLFGLWAWVVRKPAAKALLAGAFPVGGQVDHALSRFLAQERPGRCWKVDSAHMLFYSPKSEVAEDSDIQTMTTVRAVLEKYDSFEGYYDRMWGLDAILEEYIWRGTEIGDASGDGSDCLLAQRFLEMDGGDDYLDYDEYLPSPPPGVMCPPCEVSPPDCAPTDCADF